MPYAYTPYAYGMAWHAGRAQDERLDARCQSGQADSRSGLPSQGQDQHAPVVQSLASSLQLCRNNGTMFSSQTARARSGGYVISIRTATCTAGKQQLVTKQKT